MRKTRQAIWITAMLCVALGVGTSIGYAHSGGQSWTGPHGGQGVQLTTDVLSFSDWDEIDMRAGFDVFRFGSGNGTVWFGSTTNFGLSDNDWINYTENGTPTVTDDDLLVVRGDNVTVQSNTGDVVIVLGF